MTKLFMAMFLGLVCFRATAGANTIEITDGTVGASKLIVFDACAWNITGITGPLAVCSNNNLGGDFTLGETDVWIYTYSSPGPFDLPNLRFNFRYDPIPAAALQLFGTPVTEPFTMTGTLTSPPGAANTFEYDLVGRGTLDVYWSEPQFPTLFVRFNFAAVPESSSLLLIVVGMVPFVIEHRRRRRRKGGVLLSKRVRS